MIRHLASEVLAHGHDAVACRDAPAALWARFGVLVEPGASCVVAGQEPATAPPVASLAVFPVRCRPGLDTVEAVVEHFDLASRFASCSVRPVVEGGERWWVVAAETEGA